MTTQTRKIAGRNITLATGRRYLASRPMARPGMRFFDVFITDITDGCRMPGEGRTNIINDLTYAEANRILKAFNNGATSFEGRVW